MFPLHTVTVLMSLDIENSRKVVKVKQTLIGSFPLVTDVSVPLVGHSKPCDQHGSCDIFPAVQLMAASEQKVQ